VTATDQDASTSLVYSIAGGADQASFKIDAATGVLSFITPPDYETPTDADHNNSYLVKVAVSDGGLTDTQSITVNVTDVAPLIVGNDANNTLIGTAENDNLQGLGGDDTLAGTAGNDTLSGGAGNDWLDGGLGKDVMTGGLGNDVYVVESVSDAVSEGLNKGIDTVVSSISYTLGANVESLILAGASVIDGTGNELANALYGNGANNVLTGLGGNDQLDGGGGSDALKGGAGQDTLTGGAGNDTFKFTGLQDSLPALPDVITDFTAGDKINLSAIDADTGAAGDQAFHIGGGGHPGDLVLSYDALNNRTAIDLYVDKNGSIDATIWLMGDHHTMTAADFVF
jgi:Ca2+-binding RTX toxin-like protein